jgi:hypothetical protein
MDGTTMANDKRQMPGFGGNKEFKNGIVLPGGHVSPKLVISIQFDLCNQHMSVPRVSIIKSSN